MKINTRNLFNDQLLDLVDHLQTHPNNLLLGEAREELKGRIDRWYDRTKKKALEYFLVLAKKNCPSDYEEIEEEIYEQLNRLLHAKNTFKYVQIRKEYEQFSHAFEIFASNLFVLEEIWPTIFKE